MSETQRAGSGGRRARTGVWRLAPLTLTTLTMLMMAGLACRVDEGSAEPKPESPTSVDSPGAPTSGTAGEYTMPYGELTITAHADPSLAGEVERLFLLFEDLRGESVALGVDTRLPIGWTTLSFVREGQELIVHEPDYDHDPEHQTRADISVSLATLARQRAVLERAGVPGRAIGFDQEVLAIVGVLERAEVLLLRVDSPGGRLTGWRVAPAEGVAEADEVEFLRVHQILAARPELLDAMLLPPGYSALYSGERLTAIHDEHDQLVWDASLEPPEGFAPGELEGERPAAGPTHQPLLPALGE